MLPLTVTEMKNSLKRTRNGH